MDELFLGVDGGGTKTRAILCREDGSIVGFGEAGGFNINNLSPETCIANLRAALEAAFGRSQQHSVRAGFFGLCTIKDADDVKVAKDLISRTGLRAEQICIENDLANVLASGIPSGPGAALIAGTGSHVVARDELNQLTWCGGWGSLIGDVGSGYSLGIQAANAVARAHDGRGPQTMLTQALLAALEISSATGLLRAVSDPSVGTHGIAALAPLVMRAAESGDAVADAILNANAHGLAECVATAANRAALTGNFPVVFAGGVARSGHPFQPMLETAITRQLPRARFVDLQMPLECGAAAMAMRAAGIDVTPQTVFNLNSNHPLHR
jgi:N-acetylglucosamine kinase